MYYVNAAHMHAIPEPFRIIFARSLSGRHIATQLLDVPKSKPSTTPENFLFLLLSPTARQTDGCEGREDIADDSIVNN